MKTLVFSFLLLFPSVLFAQKGLSQLPPLNGYSSLDLRGQSGIAVDDTGRIWMSYSGFFLTTFKYIPSTIGLLTFGSDSTWKKIRLDSLGGPQTTYLSCIQFKDHAIWLGSDKGLIRKKGNQFTIFKVPQPNLPGDTVNHFCLKGNLYYLAMQNGLHVKLNNIPGNIWLSYDTTNSSLPTNHIYAVDVQADGICWLGTDKGVVRFDPFKNESRIFNKNNSEFRTDTILSIKVLPNGDVWAGTRFINNNIYDGYSNLIYKEQLPGLFKLSDNKFVNLVNLIGICDYSLIPIKDFNKIFNEGNKVCFAGCTIVFGAINFFAFFETDGISLIKKPLKLYSGACDINLIARNGNKYYLSGNRISPTVGLLNMDQYIEDSSYYNYTHSGDTTSNPDYAENVSILEINNISAPIRLKGDLFAKDYTKENTLSGEKGNCKSIAFVGALWMGGIADGNLYMAAGTYRQRGIDYAVGPLKILNAGITNESKLKYRQAWKLNESTIEDFKMNFNKPGYIIPTEILSWPAHGDSVNGFAPNLSPFADVNHNGRYEPQLGDYPLIKGQQEVYWIFNDQATIHGESNGTPLGMEIHGSAYAFVCDQITSSDSNKAINNTTFYHYKIINRNNRTYHNFRVGFWIDSDIGYYADDRVGSNPKEDYAFWYNGDTLDETVHGYGNKLPATALVMLKGMKDSLDFNLKASGIITYNNDWSVTGDPQRPEQYYNYICNRWKDGLPITYGGYGRGGNDSTNVFMFPGNNDQLNRAEWTEENSIIPKGDRRVMINTQGITLKPGEEQEVEYAIVYTPTNSCQKDLILNELHKDVMKVKSWYANDNFPSCSRYPLGQADKDKSAVILELLFYPNPVSQILTVEFTNAKPITALSVYALNGMLISNTKGSNLKKLDLSILSPGLYFLKVESKDGVYVRKIIKE